MSLQRKKDLHGSRVRAELAKKAGCKQGRLPTFRSCFPTVFLWRLLTTGGFPRYKVALKEAAAAEEEREETKRRGADRTRRAGRDR